MICIDCLARPARGAGEQIAVAILAQRSRVAAKALLRLVRGIFFFLQVCVTHSLSLRLCSRR